MPDQKLSLEEEQKALAACKKDLTKFSTLYKSFVDDIYRYAYVTLGKQEEAEDVTSQTFLNALEKIKDFEWRGISVRFWFLKIARNLIYEKFRKPESVSFDEKVEVQDLDGISVEEIVVEAEMKEKLKNLLLSLDEVTREVIALRIWEEYKFSEIAELTGMNKSAVEKRFYRGVERLKQILTDEQQIKADIVLVLAGVGSLKTVGEFLPSVEFRAKLASEILGKTNLLFKTTQMQETKGAISDQQSAGSGEPFGKTQGEQGTMGDGHISPEASQPTTGGVGTGQTASSLGQAAAAGAQGSKTLYWILAAVVGVVLIGGGAAGGYLWWKNKQDEKEEESSSAEATEDKTEEEEETEEVDPYEGWKTYENDEYNFSLRYPSDWELEEYGYDPTGKRWGKVNLAFRMPESLDFGIWLDPEHSPAELTSDNKSTEEVTIDSRKVKREKVDIILDANTPEDDYFDLFYYTDVETGAYNERFVYFEIGGLKFHVFSIGTSKKNESEINKLMPTFEKILASIEVEEESDPYAGWETYRNEYLGVQVKYPSDWEFKHSPQIVSDNDGEYSKSEVWQFTISRGDYAFSYYKASQVETLCEFTGTTEQEKQAYRDWVNQQYSIPNYDVSELVGSYDREILTYDNEIKFRVKDKTVCEWRGEGFYILGEFSYDYPDSSQEETIETLDKILASVERI